MCKCHVSAKQIVLGNKLTIGGVMRFEQEGFISKLNKYPRSNLRTQLPISSSYRHIAGTEYQSPLVLEHGQRL